FRCLLDFRGLVRLCSPSVLGGTSGVLFSRLWRPTNAPAGTAVCLVTARQIAYRPCDPVLAGNVRVAAAAVHLLEQLHVRTGGAVGQRGHESVSGVSAVDGVVWVHGRLVARLAEQR